MKKITIKKLNWQSLLSLLALGVFVLFATGTIPGTSQQKRQLADGRWEVAKHYSGGNTEVLTGNMDSNGLFEGPVKVTYEDDNYIVTHTEEVTMKAGVRHGLSKITYPNGVVRVYCYQHGERVEMANCEGGEKSAVSPAIDNSAYDIFMYKVPWFAFKLDALGFDSTYLKAYMDTLEIILYTNEFTLEEFDNYYDDAIDILGDTPYDSIIQMNAELSLYTGLDLIMSHEFRLATLSSFARGDSNTYQVVVNIYPYYLSTLNLLEVTDADFEGFCHEYDSIMSSYDPIEPGDPGLIDSLDERMYRTLDYMYNVEEDAALKSASLKHTLLSDHAEALSTLQSKFIFPAKKQAFEKTPQEVSEIVLLTILERFIDGDYIKSAVKEAYDRNMGIINLPTVTTDFSGYNSSTSVSIYGNVIEDGGDEVTTRGIAWGKIYNPTTGDQTQTMGTGTGDFMITLSDLTEGETYYVRAFATNSAGTAYGNCISFVAESTIGIGVHNIDNLEFRIYPNPAQEYITLHFKSDGSEGIVFTMFDLGGRIVFQKDLHNAIPGENMINLDISHLENGVYTCRIKGSQNALSIQNLIINR